MGIIALGGVLAVGIMLLPAMACARDVPGWHGPSSPPTPTPAPPPFLIPPSPAVVDPAEGMFIPRGEPAQKYNDLRLLAVQSQLSARVADTLGQIAGAERKPAPIEDARLDAVAAEMVSLVANDQPPPYDALAFSLAYHGIVEPSPHMVVVQLNSGDTDTLSGQLHDQLAGLMAKQHFVRLGVGASTANEVTTIVIALQESAVTLDPVPRALPAGGKTRLHGRVHAPYSRPEVLVTRQGGQVTQPTLAGDGAGEFAADVACGSTSGKLEVEIAAADASGSPSILANFPMWCGLVPPRSMRLAAPERTSGDATTVEKALYGMLNEDRRRAGLPALAWDPRVAAVARAHSTEMRDKGFVAHVSPTTGSSSDRVHRAGISTPVVLENLARAYSAEEADRGLMNSPGHRANILSPQATDVGIGVALGEGAGAEREVYVTQLFIRKAPIVGHQQAFDTAHAALSRARANAHVADLVENKALDDIAGGYAARMAAARDQKAAMATGVNQALDAFAHQFKEVDTLVTITAEPDALPTGSALDGKFTTFGLGIAQGFNADLGEGAYFIVYLLAR